MTQPNQPPNPIEVSDEQFWEIALELLQAGQREPGRALGQDGVSRARFNEIVPALQTDRTAKPRVVNAILRRLVELRLARFGADDKEIVLLPEADQLRAEAERDPQAAWLAFKRLLSGSELGGPEAASAHLADTVPHTPPQDLPSAAPAAFSFAGAPPDAPADLPEAGDAELYTYGDESSRAELTSPEDTQPSAAALAQDGPPRYRPRDATRDLDEPGWQAARQAVPPSPEPSSPELPSPESEGSPAPDTPPHMPGIPSGATSGATSGMPSVPSAPLASPAEPVSADADADLPQLPQFSLDAPVVSGAPPTTDRPRRRVRPRFEERREPAPETDSETGAAATGSETAAAAPPAPLTLPSFSPAPPPRAKPLAPTPAPDQPPRYGPRAGKRRILSQEAKNPPAPAAPDKSSAPSGLPRRELPPAARADASATGDSDPFAKVRRPVNPNPPPASPSRERRGAPDFRPRGPRAVSRSAQSKPDSPFSSSDLTEGTDEQGGQYVEFPVNETHVARFPKDVFLLAVSEHGSVEAAIRALIRALRAESPDDAEDIGDADDRDAPSSES